MNLKSMPLADLEVVAIVHVYGAGPDHQSESNAELMEVDLEVLNPELYKGVEFPVVKKCDCCGARLQYACQVVHVPTRSGYNVGRDCARKIGSLQRMGGWIENASVALAERAKCARHEANFLTGAPSSVVAAYQFAKVEAQPGSILSDMVEKLRRWGALSPRQIEFMVSLHEKELAKRALVATGRKCVEGKRRLEGAIVSMKEVAGFGYYSLPVKKIVVDLGDGTKVWGTLPRAMEDVAKVGNRIAFTATVTVSDRDPLFGFFKRPTKPELIGVVPVAPAIANEQVAVAASS
jgi:hypothetical protein